MDIISYDIINSNKCKQIRKGKRMKQICHNNHFVPRLYLKNWSEDRKRIWRYRLLVSHKNVPIWDYPSIENVACQSNLYTYLIEESEIDEIERWFCNEIETPFIGVIGKVLDKATLKKEDFEILIRYFAAQYVRTPARLSKQLKFYKEKLPTVVENAMTKAVQKLERILDNREPLPRIHYDESFDLVPAKFVMEKNPKNEKTILKYDVLLGRGLWLYEIKHVVSETSKVLLNHNWEIVKAAKGVKWSTSDDPVICLNYNNIDDYDFGGGWNRIGSELILPLTPQYILYTQVGCHEKHPEIQEDPCFTYLVQKFIIEHAYRNIFSTKPFNEIINYRNRTENDILFKHEAVLCRNWFEDQNEAEKNL